MKEERMDFKGQRIGDQRYDNYLNRKVGMIYERFICKKKFNKD
jgi:hypothetical protein